MSVLLTLFMWGFMIVASVAVFYFVIWVVMVVIGMCIHLLGWFLDVLRGK